jgi:glycerol uptake facilitator-like aquaporin
LALRPDVASLLRACIAEGVGTAALLAAIVGSGIMGERLADGNAAIAQLANSFATGLVLWVLIATLGPISGAHFNPAVTLVSALSKAMSWRRAVAYIGVQLFSAVVGVLLAHAMFEMPWVSFSSHIRAGSSQVLSEAIATAGLLGVIATTRGRDSSLIGALVGAYIAAAYWFTASTSFANPAVSVARSLTESFSGIRPADVGSFIVIQTATALAIGLAIRASRRYPG